MLDKITQTPVMRAMGQALQAANIRHRVISNNIANVNTPNFKKSEVVFEDLLAEKLFPDSKKLKMLRTRDGHLPMPGERDVSPKIQLINSTTMRTDGNNVDIDSEMAGLAKNTIYYEAAAKQLGSHFQGLKSVISGQK